VKTLIVREKGGTDLTGSKKPAHHECGRDSNCAARRVGKFHWIGLWRPKDSTSGKIGDIRKKKKKNRKHKINSKSTEKKKKKKKKKTKKIWEGWFTPRESVVRGHGLEQHIYGPRSQ